MESRVMCMDESGRQDESLCRGCTIAFFCEYACKIRARGSLATHARALCVCVCGRERMYTHIASEQHSPPLTDFFQKHSYIHIHTT